MGGGGVFWSIPKNKTRWINDIHPGLVEVYRALRDRPESFISACRGVVDTKSLFEEISTDDLYHDQALRYYLVNRTVWGGRVRYDRRSRLYYSNPSGWNIVKTKTLYKAAEIVLGTKITCGSYLPLLTEPGDSVWVYLDPPYIVNTELSETDKQYQFNFTMEDHEILADRVKSCPHNVSISYDDHKEVRRLYKGMEIVPNSWKYCGSSSKEKREGQEVLILNYDPMGSYELSAA